MKIFFVDNDKAVEQMDEWLGHGKHEIINRVVGSPPDVIICWGITQMNRAKEVVAHFPNVPLINYNWDIYEWVWSNPRKKEYDYKAYGEFLKRSTEIWCPSQCTVERMKQWFKLDGKVVLSSAPYYDVPVTDKRFVLMPLREIPDPQWGWFEKACEELGIPYKSTKHKLSQDEYRKVVASCSFIVSPLWELSTGGLTCLEGYYLGKPVLLSDSPYHGGKDYFGKRARYFRTYNDLKKQLKDMWEHPVYVPQDCKQWVVDNYSGEAMGRRINERLFNLGRVFR